MSRRVAIAVVLAMITVALATTLFIRAGGDAITTASPTSAAVSTGAPSPTIATSATPAQTTSLTGAVSGTFGYPGGSTPALTTYAISVADPSVFFSVSTPRWVEGSTAPPAGTGAPPGSYTITGIAPGSYYVVAYRDSDPNLPGPGLYSQWVLCVQTNTPPSCTDHRLIAVVVKAGEMVSGISPQDWLHPASAPYPPRPTR